MALDAEQIKELFPLGAVQAKKGWKPASEGEEPGKSLDALLKAKRKLQAQGRSRYPVATGPQRLRWDKKLKRWVPKEFSPDEEHGYTSNPSRALDRDPKVGAIDALDEATQARYSAEARGRHSATHADEQSRAALRSYLARLRQLAIEQIKAGNDPAPVFEAALEQMQDKGRKAA